MPGSPVEVGVLLSMDPEWHVYWQNPGQSGLPVRVDWQLPQGWSAGPLRWPVPQVFDTGGIITYGYSNQVLLTAELKSPARAVPGRPALVGATVSWLACRVECIPGSARLSASVPVQAARPAPDPRWADVFAAAAAALPVPYPTARASVISTVGSYRLEVQGWKAASARGVRFFPADTGVIDDAGAQSASLSGQALRVTLPRPVGATATLSRLHGIIVSAGGDRGAGGPSALEIDAPVRPAQGAVSPGLALALLLAFLGGILLNLMPCVLPVLSIKVLSLVRSAAEPKGRTFEHGLLYGAGVIVSFLALGGVLAAVRSAGRVAGWGFQFQDPAVVALTAALFFLIALNLFGVFEVGLPSGALGSATEGAARVRAPGLRSFLSGLLAAAVATPCTAPFMAAALGYAVMQQPAVSLLVFAGLGVGMSVPYVAVSAFPRLGARLPKPGRWMETLRQLMGFPMMAAVVWMLFVQVGLVGAPGVVRLAGALVAVGFGAWIWGRWGRASSPRIARRTAGAAGAAIVVGAALFVTLGADGVRPASTAQVPAPAADVAVVADAPAQWTRWSQPAVDAARSQGRPVFIDFTARWCLTCQVNEAVALRNRAVLAAFADRRVAAFRADWTDGDDEIAAALAGYGRAGVPVYVLYLPGDLQPRLLPEILTPRIVLDALGSER